MHNTHLTTPTVSKTIFPRGKALHLPTSAHVYPWEISPYNASFIQSEWWLPRFPKLKIAFKSIVNYMKDYHTKGIMEVLALV